MKLYENNKAAWDALAERGFPNLKEAAKRFDTALEFDMAIGFSRACHHWLSGGNASRTSDVRAAMWLKSNPVVVADVQTSDGLYLVVCPPEKADRVAKVLALLGCEMTAV